MDGRATSIGGVSVSDGRGAGSASSTGSGSGSSSFKSTLSIYDGPNGANRREWRLQVSSQEYTSNAMTVQYKDTDSQWQTAHVFAARE